MDATALLSQINALQARASTALTQVNRREVVNLVGFDEQTKALCQLAEDQDYTAETKATVMRALGELIRTMDDIETDMQQLIEHSQKGGNT